jgi:hypothetical protein
MGVQVSPSTMPGAVTPTCNECGVALCWDVSNEEYVLDRAFWDAWICEQCNGGEPMTLMQWRRKR